KEKGYDPDQSEEVAEECDEAGSHQLIECVYIRSEPRYQTTYRVAVIELKRELLKMGEDLFAQIVHYILPHRVEDHRLQIREEEAEQDHHKVESGKTGEGLHRCWMPSHILHQPSREARRGGQLRLRHWPQIEVYRYHRYVET